MTNLQKKKHLEKVLAAQKVLPKKFNYGVKQVVVLPPQQQKKDLTDYAYAKDIDEKVVKMAVGLAERMAISMVREMLSLNIDSLTERIVNNITEKITEALPDQYSVIQQVVNTEMPTAKIAAESFVIEGAELNIDRTKGLKLHGEVGEKTSSDDSTDEALEALDNLL